MTVSANTLPEMNARPEGLHRLIAWMAKYSDDELHERLNLLLVLTELEAEHGYFPDVDDIEALAAAEGMTFVDFLERKLEALS